MAERDSPSQPDHNFPQPGSEFVRPLDPSPLNPSLSNSPPPLPDAFAPDTATGVSRTPSRDSILEVAVVVLVALFLALLLKVYVAEAYMIRGKSMKPTFGDGQRVMVQKVLYDIRRGDIVIFSSKSDPHKDLIKRVIGLPGDNVFVKTTGEVLVNGEPIHESYIRKGPRRREDHGPVVVEASHYFVLGDNRPESQDSRSFDSIDVNSIKGKVILRWWPFDDLKTF